MKSNFYSQTKQQGFTLIELSVVLIIAAILVSGAIGLSGFLDKQKARSNATDIATAIRQARAEAKKSGKPVFVSVSDQQVRILRAQNQYISNTTTAMDNAADIAVVNVDPVLQLSDYEITSGEITPYFTSYGVLAPSTEYSFDIEKKDGKKFYTVRIQPNGEALVE